MTYQLYFKQDGQNFVTPFYQIEHNRSLSGTINAPLPPGYIGNEDVEGRKEFIQSFKDRKFEMWDVALEDKVSLDENKRKVKENKGGYIVDETEKY